MGWLFAARFSGVVRMAVGAAFYVNMLGFNKQAITPDFAAKHVSYILNRRKVREVGSLNAPAEYHAAQRWLTGHVQSGRKNARVWTRFILNLPHDLTHRQRVELVKGYLAQLAQGRAQFVWAIHGDTAAPHAHAVFVDRDVETGKRVARLTEAGSAHRWGKVWEDCCNQALALAGSVSRVSRWGKNSPHYERLNEEARMAQAQRTAASTALSGFPAEAEIELRPVPAATKNHEAPSRSHGPAQVELAGASGAPVRAQDSEMDDMIRTDAPMPTISDVVGFVASQVVELDRLRAARRTIADYRAAYAQVTATLIRTQSRMQVLEPELERAGTRVIKAEQEAARHTGIMQRLWQVVSPSARARAKAAKTASQMALYTLSTMRIKANNLLQEAQALQSEQTALQEKANALKSSLAIYGTDEDLDSAEKSMMRTIAINSAELTAVDLSQAMLAGHITAEEHRHLMRAIDRGGMEV